MKRTMIEHRDRDEGPTPRSKIRYPTLTDFLLTGMTSSYGLYREKVLLTQI